MTYLSGFRYTFSTEQDATFFLLLFSSLSITPHYEPSSPDLSITSAWGERIPH
jgi:hypothetical protein